MKLRQQSQTKKRTSSAIGDCLGDMAFRTGLSHMPGSLATGAAVKIGWQVGANGQ
jgi:hypothetical protein